MRLISGIGMAGATVTAGGRADARGTAYPRHSTNPKIRITAPTAPIAAHHGGTRDEGCDVATTATPQRKQKLASADSRVLQEEQ
jgi:hypothetical protein